MRQFFIALYRYYHYYFHVLFKLALSFIPSQHLYFILFSIYFISNFASLQQVYCAIHDASKYRNRYLYQKKADMKWQQIVMIWKQQDDDKIKIIKHKIHSELKFKTINLGLISYVRVWKIDNTLIYWKKQILFFFTNSIKGNHYIVFHTIIFIRMDLGQYYDTSQPTKIKLFNAFIFHEYIFQLSKSMKIKQMSNYI